MGTERRRVASNLWQAELSEAELADRAATLEALADDPFLRDVALRSIEAMEIRAGDQVLDVGCGSGALLPAFATLVGPTGSVVGLDYAAGMLERARERVNAAALGDRVQLAKGDAVALPFAAASFDAVHIERVLMHLEDPDAAIRELLRVTRPGGVIVAAEPDSDGVRVDHPSDAEGLALVQARDALQFRNASIGLELNRRFALAGIVERRIVPLTAFYDSYDDGMRDGDRIAARELVAEGLLTDARAEAVIEGLIEAERDGVFTWLGTMVIAIGRAPHRLEEVPQRPSEA